MTLIQHAQLKQIQTGQTHTSDDSINSNVEDEIEQNTPNHQQKEKVMNEQQIPQINSCDKVKNEPFGHAIKTKPH